MSNVEKGKIWERNWVNFLKDNDVDKTAGRTPQSGAWIMKGDIRNSIDITFEVKSGKQVPKKIYDFYEQVERDALQAHNVPMVVMHRDGRKQDEFMIMMNGYDWADLIKKSREPKEITDDNREVTYLVKTAIDVLKRLLKYLER